MFNFLKRKQLQSGCLEDERTQEEKTLDYQVEEVAESFHFAQAFPLNWTEVKVPHFDILNYKVRNQDGSNSCVANSIALMLGIDNYREEGEFIEFSASHIYQRRINKPQAGMVGNDALKIASKYGATLEQLMPSDKLSEIAINAVSKQPSDDQIGMVFKAGGYVQFPFDIEKIASFMEETKKRDICKPVLVWFAFPLKEWTVMPQISSNVSEGDLCRHSVTAIDYGLYKGKKVLVIQDSWGIDRADDGLRYITQEYADKRMMFAASLIDLDNSWRDKILPQDVKKPQYTFTQPLEFGRRSKDIMNLQIILAYEELFPVTISPTGLYLQITAKAVLAWQIKHRVDTLEELTKLKGYYFGPKSIVVANNLYG